MAHQNLTALNSFEPPKTENSCHFVIQSIRSKCVWWLPTKVREGENGFPVQRNLSLIKDHILFPWIQQGNEVSTLNM